MSPVSTSSSRPVNRYGFTTVPDERVVLEIDLRAAGQRHARQPVLVIPRVLRQPGRLGLRRRTAVAVVRAYHARPVRQLVRPIGVEWPVAPECRASNTRPSQVRETKWRRMLVVLKTES